MDLMRFATPQECVSFEKSSTHALAQICLLIKDYQGIEIDVMHFKLIDDIALSLVGS